MQVSSGSCSVVTPTTTSPGPSSSASPTPTASPTTGPTQPSGTNLSIGAGIDGSSKASGTSYGNAIDGSLSTYWSPTGTTGDISVKWGSALTVSTLNIREASGSDNIIGSWQVINADTGTVLKSGSGAGVITFASTSLKKVTFRITGASGAPKVAEFETYA
jgi:hypothetical protein